MIYKGCNCRCIFPFPYPRSEVSTLYVTFQEKGETVVEKEVTDCDFLEEKIVKELEIELEKTEKDLILGYTTVGPHRDDIKIKIDGEDVRVFGSQGQQRTTAISLKLAELEVFNERFNEYPILILDDALSELDGKRRAKLVESF